MAEHRITAVVVDAFGAGPLLTIATVCSCGTELARREFDARTPPPDAEVARQALADADLAEAHVRAAGGAV